jgi:hypothetical protein
MVLFVIMVQRSYSLIFYYGWDDTKATQRNKTQRNATPQRNATQRNATQHNTTQLNATQHNTTQRNATQRNAAQRSAAQQESCWYVWSILYKGVEVLLACDYHKKLKSATFTLVVRVQRQMCVTVRRVLCQVRHW